MQISNLPNIESRVIYRCSTNSEEWKNTEFQLRVRKYKKNKSEVKIILTEMKNMLESINSR